MKIILTKTTYVMNLLLSIMGTRISLVIDDIVYDRLRKIQARMIQNSNESISFSRVVNECLAKSVKTK